MPKTKRIAENPSPKRYPRPTRSISKNQIFQLGIELKVIPNSHFRYYDRFAGLCLILFESIGRSILVIRARYTHLYIFKSAPRAH